MSDVKAETIDTPAVISESGKWLQEAHSLVEEKACEYTIYEIGSDDDYKQMKRDRAAVNRDIKEIDGSRKRATKKLDDALKRFRADAKDILEPLTTVERKYHDEISEYEQDILDARYANLETEYEKYDDIARIIPFASFYTAFEKNNKWGNPGTQSSKVISGFEKSIKRVSDDLTTLKNVTDDAEEFAQIASIYAHDCNLHDAVTVGQQLREEQESIKKKVENAESYVSSHADSEPKFFIFSVKVPVADVKNFVESMKKLGVHGKKVGEE